MTLAMKDLHAILTCLAEWYPNAFTREEYLPHQPLKIGIHLDLLARCPALDHRERSAVLRTYVSRVVYLEACIEGAVRVDLDGNPAGEVSPSQARHAAAKLAEILALREEQRLAAKAANCAPRSSTPPPTAPPPAKNVSPLKARPVLRLPALKAAGARR